VNPRPTQADRKRARHTALFRARYVQYICAILGVPRKEANYRLHAFLTMYCKVMKNVNITSELLWSMVLEWNHIPIPMDNTKLLREQGLPSRIYHHFILKYRTNYAKYFQNSDILKLFYTINPMIIDNILIQVVLDVASGLSNKNSYDSPAAC